MKVIATLFLITPVVLLCQFYLAFVCSVPLRWPYYEPIIEGASIDDPGRHLLWPRGNLSPRATFHLLPSLSFRTRMGCYPMARDGTQECNFQMRFFNNSEAEISFAEQPLRFPGSSPDELIDRRFYDIISQRLPDHPIPEFRNGEVFITYDSGSSLMFKRTVLPQTFIVQFPDLIVDGVLVPMPPIKFVRHNNLTCTGFIANY